MNTQTISSGEHCPRCGLPKSHCICFQITPTTSEALFCLLLHEKEWQRETNTGHLIKALLPQTRLFTWQRNQPDPELIALLQNPDFDPYLIFPADRPELSHRAVSTVSKGNKRPLFLILDGTWKEARKIVRKSPYLDPLPLLSLTPQNLSRYSLRRNPDASHLCTAEIAIELLASQQSFNKQAGNEQQDTAQSLSLILDQFLDQYLRYKDRKA
ncbi:tRNA-uridine aminocarboxypropyltransferase [Amphritea sp. HPY]|uniref:tRNA-uridine aminocarboxypropyltransferase n=1 Tax=Amphritea sp. HPY TaxID=3421652 RepID=UPI003D7DD4E8